MKTTRDNLDYYKNKVHPSHFSFDANVSAAVIESYCTPNDGKIVQVAEAVRSKCVDSFDSEEIINALLSFTQAITYKYDTADLAKFPLETIFAKGDCEDLSVLFGSLVEALGFEAILFLIDLYDDVEEVWGGHACVGVYLSYTPTSHYGFPPSYYYDIDGQEYWICETTSQGYMIGHLPVSDPNYFLLTGYAFIT